MSNPEKIVVLCHGCFDVLHTGHIYHLKKAKEMGNYLVVSLTHEDDAKRKLKFPAEFRKAMMESLTFVDEVIITHDRTAFSAIEQVKPDFYVKGQEYADMELDVSGDIFLEKAEVEKYGGKLVFTDDEVTFSATKVKDAGSTFKDLSERRYKLKDVLQFIHDVAGLKVCVIGETIIDRWTPVKTEGVSSKSTCPTALVNGSSRNQLGGAYVVARHLQDFIKQVDLITNNFQNEYPEPLADGINHLFYADGCIAKERLYDAALNTKIFEVKTYTLKEPYQMKFPLEQYDLVIVADFGHGMLNKEVARQLSESKQIKYLSVMAQTNSSNMGFNRIDKYPSAQTYCIDKTELRLCLNHQEELYLENNLKEIESYIRFDKLFVTLGSLGSILHTHDQYIEFPALSNKVVDPIGAGDAFFSLASLTAYLGYEDDRALLLPSLSAALNTQWLCNEYSVTRAGLIETTKKVI